MKKDLLPPSWYDFEVMTAEEKISKAGNEMLAIKLKVFRPNGGEAHIYDYLMELMPDKLADFCEAVGVTDKYDVGQLRAIDCMERTGKVKIAIEEDKEGKYPPKNVAKSYASANQIVKNAPPIEDDDSEIPF